MGLHQAFPDAEIVGVDIRPQPRYPFTFVQGDALEFDLTGFDFVWASPPCQAFTQMSARYRGKGGVADSHPDLLTPMRAKLTPLRVPWVIENVVGARRKMRPTIMLHGGMFGLGVYRPRLFECSFMVLAAAAASPVGPIGVYGKLDGRTVWRNNGNFKGKSIIRVAKTLAEGQQAMGIDWMEWDELREAIPPPYSRYLAQFIPCPLIAE